MKFIQERITPLVWLFGILLALSIPLVTYHTWWKQDDNVVWQRESKTTEAIRNRSSIILITFDAMRMQDMSVYGYHIPTTPFIEKWSKQSSLFTNLRAVSNQTPVITETLMTSKRPWRHWLYHIQGYKGYKSDIESLPLVLKSNGYYNMVLIQNPYSSVKKLGVSNGFIIAPSPSEFWTSNSLYEIIDKKLYQLFGEKIKGYKWIIESDFILYKFINAITQDFSVTSTPAEIVFNRFLNILDNNPPKPFFAWIHLTPPHNPYLPPPPYMGMFDSSSKLRTFNTQSEVWNTFVKYQYFPNDLKPDINTLRARYDEYIRYCDKQLEDFITQLTIRDRLKNTVIILSSDHGESFEHDFLGHAGPHLYEQITRIPLIIKEPGQSEGKIINDLVRQIDIAPTILALANIPVPSWMRGRSLVPLLRDEKLPFVPVFSMQLSRNPIHQQISKGTIAIWKGDYKLIHYLEKNKSLLFNLKEDPEEQNNIFDGEPEIGQHLLGLIKESLKNANESIAQGGDDR